MTTEKPVVAQWWHTQNELVICTLCPRQCHIPEGKNSYCRVRKNNGGILTLESYGRTTGFCIDPIEKKPLYHFLPGTPTLSMGAIGCNLGCLHCQNADSVFASSLDAAGEYATPKTIATAAEKLKIPSVSFTYNEPVISGEFITDTAAACHDCGIKTVVVTNGFIAASPRPWFFKHIDAANVDLKAFREPFYRNITGASLKPVLDTLEYLVRETDVWVEITTLLIPDENDSQEEITALCKWIARTLGTDIPLHFSAFHPAHRMLDKPRTPTTTLLNAEKIAREAGLKHVYLGNLGTTSGQTTICPHCQARLFERTGYGIVSFAISLPEKDGIPAYCGQCGLTIPGRFMPHFGNWGNKRQQIRLS